MSYLRWATTIFAFPIGGWLAVQLAGQALDPASAALTGGVAGALIGAAQWLALGRAASWRWGLGTAAGLSLGSTIAAAITGSAITVGALALTGLITGSLVGMGQGLALRRGFATAAAWTTALAASWTIGWVISAYVITVNATGWVVFGISGALVVTIVTGLLLRRILGPTPARSRAASRAFAGANGGVR